MDQSLVLFHVVFDVQSEYFFDYDREEFYFGLDGYLTDPTNVDTDGDGLDDYLEWSVYGTDPTTNDTDSDNVTDDIDVFPLDSSEWIDTDGDGAFDEGNEFERL